MSLSRFCRIFSAAPEKIPLGRWNLKSCSELSASINSIYQNRDHCSDTICTSPKKADEYIDKELEPDTTIKDVHKQ